VIKIFCIFKCDPNSVSGHQLESVVLKSWAGRIGLEPEPVYSRLRRCRSRANRLRRSLSKRWRRQRRQWPQPVLSTTKVSTRTKKSNSFNLFSDFCSLFFSFSCFSCNNKIVSVMLVIWWWFLMVNNTDWFEASFKTQPENSKFYRKIPANSVFLDLLSSRHTYLVK
jgi:hypothetical protein